MKLFKPSFQYLCLYHFCFHHCIFFRYDDANKKKEECSLSTLFSYNSQRQDGYPTISLFYTYWSILQPISSSLSLDAQVLLLQSGHHKNEVVNTVHSYLSLLG